MPLPGPLILPSGSLLPSGAGTSVDFSTEPYPGSTLFPASDVYPGIVIVPTGGEGYPALDTYLGLDVFPEGDLPPDPFPVPPPPVPPPVPIARSLVLRAQPVILQDRSGVEVASLEIAHTIRFEISQAVSIVFSLGYDERGASELLSMLPDQTPRLQAYRNDNLVFSGWWMPQTESLDGTDNDGIQCEFRSPIARLETRYLAGNQTFSSTDAGDIAWQLIRDTNAEGDTGLVKGVLQPSINLSRSYKTGQQLGEAVNGLTQVNNSFQFTEIALPVSSGALCSFNTFSSLGRDLSKTVEFEYGTGTFSNVLSVGRTYSPPINRSIATGGTATVPSVAVHHESQAAYGLYTTYNDFSSNVNNQDHLDQLAASFIQPNAIQEVTFEPDVESTPQPIDDYWLGDRVSFRAVQDGLLIELEPQITAIEIDRDGDGVELAHRLEFGPVVVEPLTAERIRGRLRIRHLRRTGGKRAGGHHHHSAHNPFKQPWTHRGAAWRAWEAAHLRSNRAGNS
jgi:hypothetical protein